MTKSLRELWWSGLPCDPRAPRAGRSATPIGGLDGAGVRPRASAPKVITPLHRDRTFVSFVYPAEIIPGSAIEHGS